MRHDEIDLQLQCPSPTVGRRMRHNEIIWQMNNVVLLTSYWSLTENCLAKKYCSVTHLLLIMSNEPAWQKSSVTHILLDIGWDIRGKRQCYLHTVGHKMRYDETASQKKKCSVTHMLLPIRSDMLRLAFKENLWLLTSWLWQNEFSQNIFNTKNIVLTHSLFITYVWDCGLEEVYNATHFLLSILCCHKTWLVTCILTHYLCFLMTHAVRYPVMELFAHFLLMEWDWVRWIYKNRCSYLLTIGHHDLWMGLGQQMHYHSQPICPVIIW